MYKANMGIGAEMMLTVLDKNGNEVKRSGWSPNLVLDHGLKRMGEGTWVNQCAVGTGTSTPVPSQTSLESRVASVGFGAWSPANHMVESEPHFICVNTARFGLGAAAGNISEVGLGWSDTSMWDRALVRDSNGDPTVITVLPDEFLNVSIRIYIYVTNASGTLELKKPDGSVVSTHTITSSPIFSSTGSALNTLDAISFRKVYILGANASGGGSVGFTTEVISDTERVYTCVIGIGANYNVGQVQIEMNGFCARDTIFTRWVIAPVLPKTDLQELTIKFRLSWGRYSGGV